ncbi:hypothetical protein SPSYN_01160 [Sporotomaculum syntrophicum]|uniref:Uncharacterized protein n=1 Tax=Sporotomaculum syntrophicum TaxID=182264 RepID=A0A9D2WPL3_9FIRM|nr:hypothetical protein SPSYN_01160 [Sporotomaculum syntrophicum]
MSLYPEPELCKDRNNNYNLPLFTSGGFIYIITVLTLMVQMERKGGF